MFGGWFRSRAAQMANDPAPAATIRTLYIKVHCDVLSFVRMTLRRGFRGK
jgi:hypothetical protein